MMKKKRLLEKSQVQIFVQKVDGDGNRNDDNDDYQYFDDETATFHLFF